MKFQINDKVKMTNDCSPYWTVGDIGRIVDIDSDSIPYLVCFDAYCKDAAHCGNKNAWWASEHSIELAYQLMKVE